LIFVTVGSKRPFDRLIRAVDEWAALRGRSDVFAQIANATYVPKHFQFTNFVEPSEFKRLVQQAHLVVAHAGIGSIISALELGKPIVVMPRRAQFREQVNDHQVSTAKHFEVKGHVVVAPEEHMLAERLDYALTQVYSERISPDASPQLIAAIRSFLDGSFTPMATNVNENHQEAEPRVAEEGRGQLGSTDRRRNDAAASSGRPG
jgi:UDP-N-acetylglucosamine transferase subunit ALG13